MGQDTDSDLNTLRGDFAQLRADVAKLTGTLHQLLQHGRSEGVAHASAALEDIETTLKARAESLTRQVQEKPLAAAGTMFCVGLVLGLLFSGRRS